MLRSSRALNRLPFNWQKAVSRFFPETSRKYKETEGKLDLLWREVYAAPEAVAPIDWKAWSAKIQDKAAVEAIKKEYEGKAFAAPVPDVYMSAEEFKVALSDAKEAGEFSVAYAKKLEGELAALEQKKKEWYFYTLEALYAELPGYEAELARFREELNPLVPREVVTALDTLNPKEIVASLKAGKLPAFPVTALQSLPKDSPIRTAINAEYEAFRSEAAAKKVKTPTLDEIIANSSTKAASL